MNDLDIIKQLEQEIGKKLEQISLSNMPKNNGYAIDENTHVVGLNLDKLGLYTIPNILINLKKLQKLSMVDNKIETLPKLFGQLQNLCFLDLQGNKLKELPMSFGQLQSLNYLDLESNELEELPTSFGQLQNLNYLHLRDNKLKKLPVSLGQLQNLNHLDLKSNKLKELPMSFGQLQSLNYLDLENNELKELPVSFGQLQELPQYMVNHIKISKNPLKRPPLKIAKKGIGEIRNYFDNENKQMNLPDNKPVWTQDKIVMAVIAALALIGTVSTSIAIWKGLEKTDNEIQTPNEEIQKCTHSVILYDEKTKRTIKNDAMVYFLYQNDKYTFYGDSEGFYKANIVCDKNNADGKIHVEATGYEVYERNFKLDNNMQEIRLTPE